MQELKIKLDATKKLYEKCREYFQIANVTLSLAPEVIKDSVLKFLDAADGFEDVQTKVKNLENEVYKLTLDANNRKLLLANLENKLKNLKDKSQNTSKIERIEGKFKKLRKMVDENNSSEQSKIFNGFFEVLKDIEKFDKEMPESNNNNNKDNLQILLKDITIKYKDFKKQEGQHRQIREKGGIYPNNDPTYPMRRNIDNMYESLIYYVENNKNDKQYYENIEGYIDGFSGVIDFGTYQMEEYDGNMNNNNNGI